MVFRFLYAGKVILRQIRVAINLWSFVWLSGAPPYTGEMEISTFYSSFIPSQNFIWTGLEIGQTKCKRLKLPSIRRTTVSQKAVRMVSVLFFKFLDLSLTKPLWQLCAVMMSWVQRWVKLVVYWHIQRFLSYLQKIAKSFSKFLLFHSLNFHVSGSPESVSKQTTELIIELNSSCST